MNPPLGHRSSDHVGSVRLLGASGLPGRDGEPFEKGTSILSSSDAGGTNRNAEPAIPWGIPLRFADERRLAYFLGGGAACYLAFTATQEGVFASMGARTAGCGDARDHGGVLLPGVRRARAKRRDARKGTWRGLPHPRGDDERGNVRHERGARVPKLHHPHRREMSKVIPTMLLGTVMQGRRYSASEYLAAGMLVLGIALFTMGDVDTLPSFEVKGIVLIAVALCLDSAAGNFEERRFFNVPDPVHHAEVVYHANLIGMGLTCVGMWLSGEHGSPSRSSPRT